MNNLVAKIAYKIIFVATVLLTMSLLNAQSTPKVGITQLIGCGTGANVNKAQVQVAVEGTGYTYNFGPNASGINGNTAWLPSGNHTIIVTKGSKSYTLSITVPTKVTAPTYNSKIIYNCNGTGNVNLTNNQPSYQYSYTYKGVTNSSPYFSTLSVGQHTLTVNYIAPPTTKSVVFYEDFGKWETGQPKAVKSPYANPNIYFAPLNKTHVLAGNIQTGKTLADDYCYTVARMIDADYDNAQNHNIWLLPNDKDNDPNGRVMYYNSLIDKGEVLYKRKEAVRKNSQVDFSAFVFNTVKATSGNDYEKAIPSLVLEIYATEAQVTAKTPLFKSYVLDVPRVKDNGRDDWYPLNLTANTGNYTELIFVVRMFNRWGYVPSSGSSTVQLIGNDIALDNILVTQSSQSCPIPQEVPINVVANPNSFTSTITYNCTNKTAKITVNPSVTTGYTYTYTLDNGTPQSSNTFDNVSVGIHTITITYKDIANKVIFKEDFGSGAPYLLPTSVVPNPFVCKASLLGYPADVLPENHYQVANIKNLTKMNDPIIQRNVWNWEAPIDHTSNGSNPQGRYLAFNYGANAAHHFYLQDIKVEPNKPVTIKYYIYNINKFVAGPNQNKYYPNIEVTFVNKATNSVVSAATKVTGGIQGHANTNDWREVTHTFNPGNATNLQLRFKDLTNEESANDFAIDDILITQEADICTHTQTVTINPVAEVTSVTATPLVFRQGTSTTVTFTITGTPNAQITYVITGGTTQTATLNSTGKYTVTTVTTQATEINVSKVKLGVCEYSYTDKKAKVLTSLADCTTKPAPQFATTSPNGQTAVMNGVTVKRTYSNPSAATLVYGTTDMQTYCSGSTYHNYTIIHTNNRFSQEVIYTFSQPVTNAEVWLMVMGSPAGKYDEVKLSTNNGTPTFTKVYDCVESKGGAPASLTGNIVKSNPKNGSADNINDVAVRVTSVVPFTELRVRDIGTVSSGVLVELCPTSITPAETISITTQPQNQTICADKKATFTSKAQLKDATGNIQYKWQQSSNGTIWTDIVASSGTITSGGTASLTIAGTANYKYRVVYSYQFTAGIVVTATSQEATLTKLPSVALPTLTGNRTLCPTVTNNTVSFANYVTAPTGTTLLWYATPTATVSSTMAPVINTHVITRTTQTAYVRALSTTGCTSGIVTVTLTVDDTTAPTFTAPTPLNIVCNSTTATTAINNWLGTATATDACGAIATITNNYTAPANLCTVPGGIITVTFVAKDTFGNTKTGTSTIHLGVTPLVVQDDTFTVTHGLRTDTTTSVLANDRLNGNVPTAGPGGTVTITNVVPATSINGGKVPTLNPNDGKITVPAGTPAGIYTITYKECETLNPSSNCRTATAVIKVGTPTITVTPDPMTVTPSTTTRTTPSILDNDKIGGTVTPTAGPGGNVTMTVTNPTGTKVPTLDKNTGRVTIPGNTPAGNYTITYRYCEVLNPTNCTGTQTLVVTVVGTATPTPTPVAVDDRASTAVNTPVNIAVLPNDTLNGATTPNVVTSPANGTVMVNSDNTIEYRPHTGFTGTNTFVYEICNSAGCSSATVTVEVVNKIIPYSGMSVNGDGKNDHFHIGGIENYPNNVVRIYNRWGVKVFEVNGYDNVTRVFRGISDARATVEAADKLPQGTYYYVIEYYDQNNKKQSEVGWLYLKK